MPHIGLSETSSASSWVADSAAGMTAIVTGQKTHNGVISQSLTAKVAFKTERRSRPFWNMPKNGAVNGCSVQLQHGGRNTGRMLCACQRPRQVRRDLRPRGEAQVRRWRGCGHRPRPGADHEGDRSAGSRSGPRICPNGGAALWTACRRLSPVAAKASCAVALWDGEDFDLAQAGRWRRYGYFLGTPRDFS